MGCAPGRGAGVPCRLLGSPGLEGSLRATRVQRAATALAAQQGSRTVYTPQVLVSGRSLPQWQRPEDFQQEITTLTAQPAPADLRAELIPEPDQWRVRASGQARAPVARGELGLFVAIYQDRLDSQVTAGENAGTVTPRPGSAGAARTFGHRSRRTFCPHRFGTLAGRIRGARCRHGGFPATAPER